MSGGVGMVLIRRSGGEFGQLRMGPGLRRDDTAFLKASKVSTFPMDAPSLR